MDTNDYRSNDRTQDNIPNDRTRNRTTVRSTDERAARTSRTQRPTPRSTQPRRTTQTRTRERTSDRSSAPRSRSRDTARTSSRLTQAEQSGRNLFGNSDSSIGQRVLDVLPENMWIRRALLVLAALLLLFILFNLFSCIGGALAPKSDSSQSAASAESSASSQSASASSAAATTQGVASPWTDNGQFSTGDSALDNYVKQLCDEHTAEGATFDQAAYDTYIYVSRTDYVERENNQSPWGETWAQEYAKQYFEEGNTGNCYNFAAVTEYVLKYFGYSDAEAQPCIVRMESGSWGDHGLVFVTNKVDGKRCIIDDALSANGWMLGIDDYDYDVRNIAQNATVKGNVDALDDDNNPTPIPPGELTEPANTNANNANGANGATTNTTTTTDDTADQTETETDEESYDEGSETNEENTANSRGSEEEE